MNLFLSIICFKNSFSRFFLKKKKLSLFLMTLNHIKDGICATSAAQKKFLINFLAFFLHRQIFHSLKALSLYKISLCALSRSLFNFQSSLLKRKKKPIDNLYQFNLNWLENSVLSEPEVIF